MGLIFSHILIWISMCIFENEEIHKGIRKSFYFRKISFKLQWKIQLLKFPEKHNQTTINSAVKRYRAIKYIAQWKSLYSTSAPGVHVCKCMYIYMLCYGQIYANLRVIAMFVLIIYVYIYAMCIVSILSNCCLTVFHLYL